VQETARPESTLNRKKHFKEQQNQRKAAGKKSAIVRATGAEKRRLIVKRAFQQLDPLSLQRMQPNSADTMDALKAAYDRELIKAGYDLKSLTGPPFKVRDETLRSDLKRLGFRSWLRSK
jgi:hypothetical protein